MLFKRKKKKKNFTVTTETNCGVRVSQVHLSAHETKYNWWQVITVSYITLRSPTLWNAVSSWHSKQVYLFEIKHKNMKTDDLRACLCSVPLQSVQHVYSQRDRMLNLSTARWQVIRFIRLFSFKERVRIWEISLRTPLHAHTLACAHTHARRHTRTHTHTVSHHHFPPSNYSEAELVAAT